MADLDGEKGGNYDISARSGKPHNVELEDQKMAVIERITGLRRAAQTAA
jgi:hypothetical protein